jgi:cell division protein FtsL
MSLSAPDWIPSAPAPVPSPRHEPARPMAPPRERRRRHHLGFVLFTSALVGALVVGLVSLNAFVAQSSFRIDDLQHRIEGLSGRYVALQKQAAHLSAPDRIAQWAARHGLSFPADGELHILHVAGTPRSRTAGSGAPGAVHPSLKPIVDGGE